LKIHHALKETSYPTDQCSMTGSATIATTIGNYLLANHRAASTRTGSYLIFDIYVESNFLKFSANWPVWWEFRSFPA
jgi:hypothetical protein